MAKGAAAFVVCSGKPELVALAPELPLEEALGSGVSPAGIDMTPLDS
jgi:hypothetical protein